MRTNRTPDEWNNWCLARERIAKELKEYYQACATKELPPRLVALTKKFNEEPSTDQAPLVRDIES
jgi:hypothetical protein